MWRCLCFSLAVPKAVSNLFRVDFSKNFIPGLQLTNEPHFSQGMFHFDYKVSYSSVCVEGNIVHVDFRISLLDQSECIFHPSFT
jgi:hypothetical protein